MCGNCLQHTQELLGAHQQFETVGESTPLRTPSNASVCAGWEGGPGVSPDTGVGPDPGSGPDTGHLALLSEAEASELRHLRLRTTELEQRLLDVEADREALRTQLLLEHAASSSTV